MLGAGEHVFAFARCDVVFGKEVLFLGQCFDFHKNSDSVLFGDDVNFTVWRADVARDDLTPFGEKIFRGKLFPPCTDPLIVFGHELLNRSKNPRRRVRQLLLRGNASRTSLW